MLEAIVVQMENNRRQQEQIRKDFYRYSEKAAQAKTQLMQLVKNQIDLKMWGNRNAKLKEKNTDAEPIEKCTGTQQSRNAKLKEKNTDAEPIEKCTGTQQSDEKAIGRDSEKGEQGS